MSVFKYTLLETYLILHLYVIWIYEKISNSVQ